MTVNQRPPRLSLVTTLAVALLVANIGAAVAALPDVTSTVPPAPTVSPKESPTGSPAPASGTALLRVIGRAQGGCGSPNGCAWFLETIRDGDASTRHGEELGPIPGSTSLVPDLPTPQLLTQGSYVATASSWRLGPSSNGMRILTGIDASCPLSLTVAAGPPSVILLRVVYHPGACEITLDPGAPSEPGSSPAPGASLPPVTGGTVVTSDDGRLTVELADGAALPGMILTATAHGSAALPPELAALGLREPLYTLEPRGQGLQRPVVIRETFAVAELPEPLLSGGLVPFALALRDPSGAWTWLSDQHLTKRGPYVSVSGLTTQLGDVYAFVATSAIRATSRVWGDGGPVVKGKGAQIRFTLRGVDGGRSYATFSGDWLFGGGYPVTVGVAVSVSEAGQLAARWRCLKVAGTELSTTFGFLDPTGGYGDLHALTGLAPLRSTIDISFAIDCLLRARPGG